MELEVVGATSALGGQTVNVSCRLDSFPPSQLRWFGPNGTSLNRSDPDLGSASLVLHSLTQAQSGLYTCEGVHETKTQTRSVYISVIYLREVQISGDSSVTEHGPLRLTCSVDSFPLSNISFGRPGSWSLVQPNRLRILDQSLVQPNRPRILDQSPVQPNRPRILDQSLVQPNRPRILDQSLVQPNRPRILGQSLVQPNRPRILDQSLVQPNRPRILGQSLVQPNRLRILDPGSVTLLVPNVTLEHGGRYECIAEHDLGTLTSSVDVKVLRRPHILRSSGCVRHRDVLSCVCVSRASPVPSVSWSLLQDQHEYSLVTVVTGDTINSSFVLRGHNTTEVQCVSQNRAGQARDTFTVSESQPTGRYQDRVPTHWSVPGPCPNPLVRTRTESAEPTSPYQDRVPTHWSVPGPSPNPLVRTRTVSQPTGPYQDRVPTNWSIPGPESQPTGPYQDRVPTHWSVPGPCPNPLVRTRTESQPTGTYQDRVPTHWSVPGPSQQNPLVRTRTVSQPTGPYQDRVPTHWYVPGPCPNPLVRTRTMSQPTGPYQDRVSRTHWYVPGPCPNPLVHTRTESQPTGPYQDRVPTHWYVPGPSLNPLVRTGTKLAEPTGTYQDHQQDPLVRTRTESQPTGPYQDRVPTHWSVPGPSQQNPLDRVSRTHWYVPGPSQQNPLVRTKTESAEPTGTYQDHQQDPLVLTRTESQPTVTPETILQRFSELEVFVGFLSGFFVAALLCCVVVRCR
uniref:Ig-like domain-containing protein n=1 Tax=Knipowitschia caucasica TaxID=637954 RepID=A0AAV2M9J9_KNICA